MSNNKKFKYYKKKPKNNTQEDIKLNYPSELLTIPVQEMKLSETTIALLTKNKVNVSGEIVMRTEKDMYKIQGLNKKILIEVINALKELGLELRPMIDNNQQNKQQNTKTKEEKQQENQKQEKTEKVEKKSKFGFAEKDNQKNEQKSVEKPIKENSESTNNEMKKFIKGGKWGYSLGNKIIIPAMYDEIFTFKEELACVEVDEKCGFIDLNNNIIIPIDYDLASSFSDGLAMVCKNNKCGYINKNNELIIPFDYDAATPFEEGEAKVKKDGKWATIDKLNNLTWII